MFCRNVLKILSITLAAFSSALEPGC